MSSVALSDQERKLFERELKEAALDVSTYSQYMYSIVTRTELDLMFIVDCTGSMSSWIEAVKNEILAIVKGIKAQFQTSCIRLSFVGYRDLKDKVRFEIFPFQTNWRQFKSFVGSVRANGGNDFPEDVFGGFDKALSQKWASSARYAVFIADAPGHGIQYHKTQDDYPKGDPSGLDLEHFMKDFSDKRIKFYFAKLSSETDQMMTILSKEYQKHTEIEIGQADLGKSAKNFSKFIIKTALETLEKDTEGVSNSKSTVQQVYYKIVQRMRGNTQFDKGNLLFSQKYADVLSGIKHCCQKNADNDAKEPQKYESLTVLLECNFFKEGNQSRLKVIDKLTKVFSTNDQDKQKCSHQVKVIKHTFSIKRTEENKINWEEKIQFTEKSEDQFVEIGAMPFSKGKSNYVFALKDQEQQKVLRLPMRQIAESVEDFQSIYYDQLVAQHILNAYSIKNLYCAYEITYQGKQVFLPSEIYENSALIQYDSQSSFQSYTFDVDGLKKQCLAHFSYEHTCGQYMIANFVSSLNMFDSLILKPLVYSKNFMHIPSLKNQGYVGIFKFFIVHTCTDNCQKRTLVDLEEFSDPSKLNFKLPLPEPAA